MASGYLIIDGRKDGLPHAPGYYRTFPREPSPLGDITLSARKTSVMSTTSLATVLVEMPKAGAGGIVVLVCHAWSRGLYMPIAPGGQNMFANVDNLATIDKLIRYEVEVANIRRLPRRTPDEKKAVLERWEKVLNDIKPNALVGPYPDEELDQIIRKAETEYGRYLDSQARSFEFPNRALLLQMLANLRKVRDLRISRLELRACKIGADRNLDTMKVVRKFFNVTHLTAPKLETFYLSPVEVKTMAKGARPGEAFLLIRGVLGANKVPGPTGINPNIRDPEYLNVLFSRDLMAQVGHTRRGFFERTMLVYGWNWSIPLGTSYLFILTVDSPKQYSYFGSAFVASTGDLTQPNWTWVKWFVDSCIMPNSGYSRGPFPVAGFWNPERLIERGLRGSVSIPFVLPNEMVYTELISHVS
jgi:hypothetical protein